MAASTSNPLVGFARAMGILLLIPIGLVLLLVLIVVGFEAAYFFQGRPADVASMAAKRNVDLGGDAGSVEAMTAALGPPAGHDYTAGVTNATDYWWWRDAAVRVEAIGDTPVTIDIGPSGGLHLLPYRRPDFPGSFLGLRIGDPAPTPAQDASLQSRAEDCCDGPAGLTWDVKGGRVTAIHFNRSHYYYPAGR